MNVLKAKVLARKRLILVGILVVAVGVSVMGGALGEVFGLGFLAGPLAEVAIFPEVAFNLGFYSLHNTTIMLWVAGLTLIAFGLFFRFRATIVPGFMQSIFEVVIEFFQKMADGMGGEKSHKFVAIAVLIFLTVLMSNWFGIIPLAGPIGRLETAGEYIEHQSETYHSRIEEELTTNGISYTSSEVHALGLIEAVKHGSEDTFVAFDGSGVATIPFGRGQQSKVSLSNIIPIQETQLTSLEQEISSGVSIANLSSESEDTLHNLEDYIHDSTVQNAFLNSQDSEVDLRGKTAGILIPYLRGASTDIYTTLSISLVAVFMIQYFGFSTLGFRGYGGKFVNLSFLRPKGSLFESLVAFVLGFLELIGEFARTISFTFRLFGNLFAGEILLFAMAILLPIIGLVPFLGLEIFVGLIQAFIFASLVFVFSYIATQSHGSH